MVKLLKSYRLVNVTVLRRIFMFFLEVGERTLGLRYELGEA